MIQWIINNIATIAVALVVTGAVAAVIIKMLRDRKAGKSACNCGSACSGCAMKGMCHK